MKKAVLFLAVGILSLTFFSCEKRQVRKNYESLFGNYSSSLDFMTFEDDNYTDVVSNEMIIQDDGIFLSYKNPTNIPPQPSCVFKVYETNNSLYDYRLEFSSQILYTFNFESGEMEYYDTPPQTVLNQDKLYYIKKTGENSILFVIEHSDGEIQSHTFTK